MLEEVRQSLLDEARLSPQLLSDLAGLEGYVAESYDSRSFIELLQNADDAGASSFLVKKVEKYLVVANSGKAFSKKDFEAICRSASSTKQRGNSIGYRGIGFKSVVGLAKQVHIVSGDLEVTFSRELTSKDVPQASKVPLIRIPHPIDALVYDALQSEIRLLRNSGYNTFFIFSELIADSIDNEFINFDPSSLLFLKNIGELSLRGSRVDHFKISRSRWDDLYSFAQLSCNTSVSNWLIATENQVSVAFYQDPDSERIQALSERDALVHAFLPTNEPTGLGVKINGDISTDPSRTRVVFDQRTADGVAVIAQLICKIIKIILIDDPLPDSLGMLAAILPLEDPRLHKYQRKTFKSELLSAIGNVCAPFIKTYSLKPAWLNSIDFELLSNSIGLKSAPRIVSDISGASSFLRYLGAKEADFKDVAPSLNNVRITQSGCSEIVSELVRLSDTKQINPTEIDTDWPIFISGGKNVSINQAKRDTLTIDSDFVDSVGEKTTGASGLLRLISSISGSDTCSKLISVASPPKTSQATSSVSSNLLPLQKAAAPLKSSTLSLKKWRGAEEQLKNIFSAQGWSVDDVSRQNIGYDLECENNEGSKLFIEVKLIESSSQPFILTSNEEAVSRMKGSSYLIALVKQSGDYLEVSFIPDPSNTLELVRQCRQWVWECSVYPYNPTTYRLE